MDEFHRCRRKGESVTCIPPPSAHTDSRSDVDSSVHTRTHRLSCEQSMHPHTRPSNARAFGGNPSKSSEWCMVLVEVPASACASACALVHVLCATLCCGTICSVCIGRLHAQAVRYLMSIPPRLALHAVIGLCFRRAPAARRSLRRCCARRRITCFMLRTACLTPASIRRM